MPEVALSKDGSLAASYAIGENENSLIVQRTNDGSLVKTIYALYGKNASSDSKHFIQAKVAYYKARGERFFTPPPFRKLSAVAIWNRNRQLQRTFFTNNRYRELAWSHDSKYFALINQDLSLQIFQVP